MFYTLIETQITGEAKAVVPPIIFDDEDSAMARYFQTCSAMTQSSCDYHSCCIIPSDGVFDKDKCYIRDKREEKTDFFTVVEVQQSDGVKAVLPVAIYDTEAEALSEYFSKCSFAVVSASEYVAVHIIRSDGLMTEGRVLDRIVIEEEIIDNLE